MSEYDAFANRLRELVEGDTGSEAADLARKYWTEDYTGRYFHVFADDDHPNEITERDIVAVSTLSVTIPAPVAIWLRSPEGRATVGELLSGVRTDVDIWDAGALLGPEGNLWKLWDLLRRASWPSPKDNNDMGPTKVSKLLAAKRPRLVPVWDSVVEGMFPRVKDYWAAFAHALSDESLRERLSVLSGAGAPAETALLRRIDAMLWMVGKHGSSAPPA